EIRNSVNLLDYSSDEDVACASCNKAVFIRQHSATRIFGPKSLDQSSRPSDCLWVIDIRFFVVAFCFGRSGPEKQNRGENAHGNKSAQRAASPMCVVAAEVQLTKSITDRSDA